MDDHGDGLVKDQAKLGKLLDEALKDSFPASDPVSVEVEKSPTKPRTTEEIEAERAKAEERERKEKEGQARQIEKGLGRLPPG